MTQPLSLLEQLRNLERLQELDLKIDSLKKNQTSLPAALKAMDLSISKLKVALETKKTELVEIEKSVRQTRAALDLNQERLTRSNTKLEQVHNSQEFQACSKEIDQLKKLNLSLSEQEKKSQSDAEGLQTASQQIGEELEKIQSEREAQAQVLLGQDHQMSSDIGSLVSERSQFSSHVDTKIIAQYNRVRAARGGIGIVAANGGRCKGCNMMVPPQMFNELQRGTIAHSCPSCNRLLFIPSSSEEVVQQKKLTKVVYLMVEGPIRRMGDRWRRIDTWREESPGSTE